MLNTTAIKNLCIALRALSRIPDSFTLSHRTRELLEVELTRAETYHKERTEREAQTHTSDDNIPY